MNKRITISRKIQSALIGSDYLGADATAEIISEITGEKFKLVDSGIDDGVDEDETEDTYVMRDTFSASDYDVRVYYGDVTEEIGYVSVDWR